MRRNDVVSYKGGGYAFPGRIIKRIGSDRVMWLCCGLHFHVTKIDDLEILDYKGRFEFAPDGKVTYYKRRGNGRHNYSKIKFERKPHFFHMTSLRKLKQRASQHHGRDAWKTPEDYEFIR